VHRGRETSTHYFSCSGWAKCGTHKQHDGTSTPNLCFCIWWDLWVRSVFWCVRGMKHRCTIFHAPMHQLRMPQKVCWDTSHQTCTFASVGICRSHSALWCAWGVKRRHTISHARVGPCGSCKKCIGTHRAELVFLHLVGSVGPKCILVHPGCETSTHYFSCSCAPGADPTKSVPEQITSKLCFYIQCVLSVQCAFWCVWGVKHRLTIFILLCARCRSHKKRAGTYYTKLVFLHPVGFVSHVVRSSAFVREMSMLYYSRSGGPGMDPNKSVQGHITSTLCFCI
jgi:hypothetical protein